MKAAWTLRTEGKRWNREKHESTCRCIACPSIRPGGGSPGVTHRSACAQKWILPLVSASYFKQNLLLCLSPSFLLSRILSYICMRTLNFCKHNSDFSKQWHGNKEKLRHACILNTESSFSLTFSMLLCFYAFVFLCFPTSRPTLKESAANKQLGPPLPRKCKHCPRPTHQKYLLVTQQGFHGPMDDFANNVFIKFILVEMEIMFTGGELYARSFANITSNVKFSQIL